MNQWALVIEYVREFGKIMPAKMGGKIYKDVMFGSETGKRCRELRDGYRMKGGTKYPLLTPEGKPYPLLGSDGEGRFEVFFFKESKPASLIETFDERKIQALFEFEPAKKFKSPYGDG